MSLVTVSLSLALSHFEVVVTLAVIGWISVVGSVTGFPFLVLFASRVVRDVQTRAIDGESLFHHRIQLTSFGCEIIHPHVRTVFDMILGSRCLCFQNLYRNSRWYDGQNKQRNTVTTVVQQPHLFKFGL